MALLLRTSVLWLAMVVAVLNVAGCTTGTEVDTTARDAAIYRTVITDVVDRSGVPLDASEDLPVLFIEAFDADGIPLEVQVEVVSSFIDEYDIRFIDDRDEALDLDVAELPVRVASLLIGLGPIVLGGSAELRSELYLSVNDVRAYRYTLSGSKDRWQLVDDPETIEPEGFVSVS